jgi:outer membrane protein assembly factor BamB
MAPGPIIFTFVISIISQLALAQGQPDYNANWPQWRGPLATGEATAVNPPVEWSETKNVKWKVEIPGRGHSTPIIWGEKVFILTAVETNEKGEKPAETSNEGRRMPGRTTENMLDFKVMALNRADGSLLWEKSVAKEAPVDGTHETGTWASNSPVTDGEHLYAYFGSRGLYCMDFNGNVLWQRDFGQMSKKMSFGEGSSPALYKDRIVVLWDHEGDSFLYILDKKTGKDIMKIARDEATSWSSPLIVELDGKAQVITSATTNIRCYDLESGEIIWKGTGMTANVIPHPIENDGVLYLMSGFRGNALMAIDLAKARGDIDGTNAILWEYNQNTSYTPSALLAAGKLYFLRSNNGNLTCLDASTGQEHYSLERLDGTGTIFASPVGAKDKLYITSQSGISYVVRQGPTFEILAKNELEDGNFSSPAIVENELFIRGFKYLYCIAEK